MLNIGGELAFILQDIDYKSKQDLLEKLRGLRDSLRNYPEQEKELLKPILSVAIQQAFYASEWELNRYKNFCDYRSKNGRS
ncbi:MAG: hypothetical protein ACI4PF_04400 [Christensenellales bacterium]